MKQDFEKKLHDLFERLGQSSKMVLATSLDGAVSARTMSVLIKNGRFYFQTDKTFRKYRQISGNKNVALCVDNIQIEGTCKEIGNPTDDMDFCREYQKAFPASFASYSQLENERLFEVMPNFIQQWIYEDGMPFVERFDIQKSVYRKEAYKGR